MQETELYRKCRGLIDSAENKEQLEFAGKFLMYCKGRLSGKEYLKLIIAYNIKQRKQCLNSYL